MAAAVQDGGQAGGTWMQRHPRWALLTVNLLGLLIAFAIAEGGLRLWGMQPGHLEMGWENFQPLAPGETLQVFQTFYTDSLGIFKASRKPGIHGEGVYINTDGFRSPEFQPDDSARRKVMLLGDSYVWGASATPWDSTFADRLRRPDWQVMNLGIPGMNPQQYARVAQHYLPILKPDVVCLFYYQGNDRMELPMDTLLPHQALFHITNHGWLDPFCDGPHLGDAQATYAYIQQRYLLPRTTIFNRFCAATVAWTLAWRGLLRLGWIDAHYPPAVQARYAQAETARKQGPYDGPHLLALQQACAAAGVPLLTFYIPQHNDVQPPTAAVSPVLLQLQPRTAPDLSPDDYNPRPDGHLNNAGHRKLAAFVATELQHLLAPPP